MKLPIALAALFFAATAALPAFAATAAPRDVMQYQRAYGDATGAYAAAPRFQPQAGWGHCVSGLESSARSAYPSWDVCRGG